MSRGGGGKETLIFCQPLDSFTEKILAGNQGLLLAHLAPILATTWLKRAFDEAGVRVGPLRAQDRDLQPAPRRTCPLQRTADLAVWQLNCKGLAPRLSELGHGCLRQELQGSQTTLACDPGALDKLSGASVCARAVFPWSWGREGIGTSCSPTRERSAPTTHQLACLWCSSTVG